MPTCEDVLEGKLDVAGIESGGFDEGEVVLACTWSAAAQGTGAPTRYQRTCKLLGILRGHSPQVSQIALVSNKHDDDVGVGMVAQLLQPPGHVVVGLVLADIVDEQSTDGTAIVGRGDGPVALLTRGIPNLRLDGLGVDLDGASRELDTDGRLGVQVELVAGESAQQVGLADTGVSDEDNCIGKGITSQLQLHGRCNRARGKRRMHQGGAARHRYL